jgi:molybdopterin converting factor small subunit
MSVPVGIPTALRAYAGGQATLDIEGATVAEVIQNLSAAHPSLARHIRDDAGKLRSFVNVYLNDEDIRFLPDKDGTALKPGDGLLIVPSIAGGAA